METYKIRVKDGRIIAGYAIDRDSARLQIMPGVYMATWQGIAFQQNPTQRTALRLTGADSRGGDLLVLKEEFLEEFADFPNLAPTSMFEVIK
ncbi:hypothetical protein ACUHMQ_12850 [Chitinimonas sp. PSY-7]|uniref:hypothetical protein n=1 Tax=Chitinimonas sp. PSY-7 TaxID=3459088 RepID=UPI0040401A35